MLDVQCVVEGGNIKSCSEEEVNRMDVGGMEDVEEMREVEDVEDVREVAYVKMIDGRGFGDLGGVKEMAFLLI
jgi:hypothetical protein